MSREAVTYRCRPQGTYPGHAAEIEVQAADMWEAAQVYARRLLGVRRAGARVVQGEPPKSTLFAPAVGSQLYGPRFHVRGTP